jgi:hypothetical protein
LNAVRLLASVELATLISAPSADAMTPLPPARYDRVAIVPATCSPPQSVGGRTSDRDIVHRDRQKADVALESGASLRDMGVGYENLGVARDVYVDATSGEAGDEAVLDAQLCSDKKPDTVRLVPRPLIDMPRRSVAGPSVDNNNSAEPRGQGRTEGAGTVDHHRLGDGHGAEPPRSKQSIASCGSLGDGSGKSLTRCRKAARIGIVA